MTDSAGRGKGLLYFERNNISKEDLELCTSKENRATS